MLDQILGFDEKTRSELIQDILDREKKIEDQEKQIRELEQKLGKRML